jgi:hypothetical protein
VRIAVRVCPVTAGTLHRIARAGQPNPDTLMRGIPL